MFCEKCGTKVDDGQPFCPNCGNRLGVPEAPAAPAAAPRARRPMNPGVGPLAKLNAMAPLEKLFYLLTVCLLPVCFILSMLQVYDVQGRTIGLAFGAAWLCVFAVMYFTIAIGLVVLEHLNKLSGKWIWFFVACGATVIFLMYVLTWIAGVDILYMSTSSTALSVGGWFFLILQAGLVGCSIVLLLQKLKKK